MSPRQIIIKELKELLGEDDDNTLNELTLRELQELLLHLKNTKRFNKK